MRVRCLKGCFEREIPKHLEAEIKENQRFHVCAYCFGRVIIEEVIENVP
jgi:hypothetical protein